MNEHALSGRMATGDEARQLFPIRDQTVGRVSASDHPEFELDARREIEGSDETGSDDS